MMTFFRKRPGSDDELVSELIGNTEDPDGSWLRNMYLEISNWMSDTDWQTAWHGCKWEALYVIMYAMMYHCRQQYCRPPTEGHFRPGG